MLLWVGGHSFQFSFPIFCVYVSSSTDTGDEGGKRAGGVHLNICFVEHKQIG